MNESDVIVHWRKGARSALQAARLIHKDGHHALALFNCHLAVEKALKAVFMEERSKEAPATHNLVLIADQLKRWWSPKERRELDYLTQYAVAARYDDPIWAEHEATAENCMRWLSVADDFLSSLLP